MKNIRTIFKLAACFSILFGFTEAYAGEYYTYYDPAGKLVISNSQPPPGSKIIKQETLPEITDAQLEEARKREDVFWTGLKTEESNRCIWEARYAKPEQPCVGNETNIAVGVTQGFPLGIRRPFPFRIR